MYNLAISSVNFRANGSQLRQLEILRREKAKLENELELSKKRFAAIGAEINNKGGNVSGADHYEELREAFYLKTLEERIAELARKIESIRLNFRNR